MVFASPLFLSIFMPILCICYACAPLRVRNAVLLLACMVFYGAGAGEFFFLLLGLTGITVGLGRFAYQNRLVSAVAIILNLAPLVYYKYSTFLGHIILDIQGIAYDPLAKGLLPLGISFYTFHAISYIVDVYTGRIAADQRGFRYALYLFLFPHLIAGPIVRYREIERQFADTARAIRVASVSSGMQIFLIGLSKKLLIGDYAAGIADRVFGQTVPLTMATAWIGVFAYTMQIYFDFSGYSDMAMGLAKMFGFRFPRNFRRPYSAQSMTDFWRRWHISLSRWLRDYVYIPLGGNRHGTARTYLNLWLIFFVCGLWHGANYTFVVWGIGHGILMVVERLGWWRPRGWWGQLATFGWVMLLWVPFRADSMAATLDLWSAMVGLGSSLADRYTVTFLDPRSLVILTCAGLITMMPQRWLQQIHGWFHQRQTLRAGGLALLAVLALMQLISQGFTPFIYANF
jgi:alginate O-acetyltransferase complex protein AlgI